MWRELTTYLSPHDTTPPSILPLPPVQRPEIRFGTVVPVPAVYEMLFDAYATHDLPSGSRLTRHIYQVCAVLADNSYNLLTYELMSLINILFYLRVNCPKSPLFTDAMTTLLQPKRPLRRSRNGRYVWVSVPRCTFSLCPTLIPKLYVFGLHPCTFSFYPWRCCKIPFLL